jgi:hypothetical protein
MAFGEFSPKWLCPVKRPRRPSQHHRTAAIWVVGIAIAVLLMLLIKACPVLQAS